MFSGLEFELIDAARKLVKQILDIKPGEDVTITADSGSDWRAVIATAQAVKMAQAKPTVIWFNMARNVGMAAEREIAARPIRSAVLNSDVWIEFNKSWLLYSSIYEDAIKSGRIRHLILVGMDADMMVRLIGGVNLNALYEFQRKLASIIRSSREIVIKSPNGTNITFINDPERPVRPAGEITGPGASALVGQVNWAPIEDTINGVLVIDGSMCPPFEIGLIRTPIRIKIEKGRITEISGGREAGLLSRWLEELGDPKMYNVAHATLGCHPNARLTGNILEDERIWGSMDFGFGSQAPGFKGKVGLAISHTDGVFLDATLMADGEYILRNGEYVHKDLKDTIRELRKE